ncbi:glutathione S-transferase N-terminal domain-containing protein [Salinispira pacifica]
MYKLFVDLDGVLVDFEKGVREVTGREVHEMSPRQMWPKLARAPHFYAGLDWTPDGRELWQHIEKHGPTVLSGLPLGFWARPQKIEWCRRELGEDVPVITCMSREKARKGAAATPDGQVPLLIDDRESICESWEQMGGVFVLHRSASETIGKLQELGLA